MITPKTIESAIVVEEYVETQKKTNLDKAFCSLENARSRAMFLLRDWIVADRVVPCCCHQVVAIVVLRCCC